LQLLLLTTATKIKVSRTALFRAPVTFELVFNLFNLFSIRSFLVFNCFQFT